MRNIFIAGGSGYIGRHLIPELLARGHGVRALVRAGSLGKLPRSVEPVLGDALDRATYADKLAPSDTFVQLVGVAHPGPAKARQFREIDLRAVTESALAVRDSPIEHFVYLSVAQPAPVMRAYVDVRAEGERLVRETGIAATFVRPWYVLGPGHRWPYAVLPLYWFWSLFPAHRDTARRLHPVTLAQVVRAIADAIDAPRAGVRVIEAPEMRATGSPVRPVATSESSRRPA